MDVYYKVDPLQYQEIERRHIEWKTHRNMDRTELMEVCFYTDCNPEFIHDVVFTGQDKPLLRTKQHEEQCTKEPLRLILLEVYQAQRQYGHQPYSTPVEVWEMVVMDGSYAMFKLVLNSRVQDVPHEELHVGTTIFMQDSEYSIIRNKVARDGNQRGVLFVNNLL
jgi:hypothetical protein